MAIYPSICWGLADGAVCVLAMGSCWSQPACYLLLSFLRPSIQTELHSESVGSLGTGLSVTWDLGRPGGLWMG